MIGRMGLQNYVQLQSKAAEIDSSLCAAMGEVEREALTEGPAPPPASASGREEAL